MQHDLFATDDTQHWALADDGWLTLHTAVFETHEADQLLMTLKAELDWQQSRIRIAGRELPIPRLNAWYGDADADYGYSGIALAPLPWTPELTTVRQAVQQRCDHGFNSVLANLYRDGQDSVAWHADDEKALGRNPVIASVSLGGTRRFQLKHRRDKTLSRIDLDLPHNSLLVMGGALQHHWVHAVPKTRKPCDARINLTFRRIITPAQSTGETTHYP
ncbi:MAG TPA: alpha-ketoglutarate-dependent dioxygenase AlkB [Gammaproteobacteria bacterium]|nr:alpha-ketoglutarate-dependent dioxygenase AlkB [Gammaproteobacteria bacterium]